MVYLSLNNLSLLSIEDKILAEIYFEDLINNFAKSFSIRDYYLKGKYVNKIWVRQ